MYTVYTNSSICLTQVIIQHVHRNTTTTSVQTLSELTVVCSKVLLLLWHLAQIVHLEQIEIAAVQLDNTLIAVNAQ